MSLTIYLSTLFLFTTTYQINFRECLVLKSLFFCLSLVILQIGCTQGIEILKIFKDFALKTSILDDFIYYEDRQKIMLDEKYKLLGKNYDTSFFVPTFVPSNKTNVIIKQPPKAEEKATKHSDLNSSQNSLEKRAQSDGQVVSNLDNAVPSMSRKDTRHAGSEKVNDVASVMKIGSLSIELKNLKEGDTETMGAVKGGTAPIDVVTVGSMPVRVTEFGESSSGVRTVHINPKAFKLKKADDNSTLSQLK